MDIICLVQDRNNWHASVQTLNGNETARTLHKERKFHWVKHTSTSVDSDLCHIHLPSLFTRSSHITTKKT